MEPGVGAGQQGWIWLKVSGETRAPSPWGGHPGGLQGHAGPGVHGREAQYRRRAGLTQGRGVQIREPGVPGLRDAMGRLEDGHGWAPRRQCLSTKTLPGEGGTLFLDPGPSGVARQPGPEPRVQWHPSQGHAAGRQHHSTLCAATHVHGRGAGSHGQGPHPGKSRKMAGRGLRQGPRGRSGKRPGSRARSGHLRTEAHPRRALRRLATQALWTFEPPASSGGLTRTP